MGVPYRGRRTDAKRHSQKILAVLLQNLRGHGVPDRRIPDALEEQLIPLNQGQGNAAAPCLANVHHVLLGQK